MKSFRLISLQVITNEDKAIEIPLTEGLIINKEDEQSRWIIEGFVHKRDFTDELREKLDEGQVNVRAVITKSDNTPATFASEVFLIKQVEDYYSILLRGKIIHHQSAYAEMLLEYLIEKGFEGQELSEEFRSKLRSRPMIPALKR